MRRRLVSAKSPWNPFRDRPRIRDHSFQTVVANVVTSCPCRKHPTQILLELSRSSVQNLSGVRLCIWNTRAADLDSPAS